MSFPWKYISLSFVIGLLLGGALGLVASGSLRNRSMKGGSQRFIRRLDRELQLTEAQRTQIQSVFETSHKRLDTFHDEVRQTVRTETRKLLTAEQQPKFDALNAKSDARRKNRSK